MKIFFNIKAILLSVLMVIGFVGCGGSSVSPTYENAMKNGEVLYTQQNIRYAKSMLHGYIADASNYEKGFIIPVNTKVKLREIGSNSLVFIAGNKEIILDVHPKYTGFSVSDVAEIFLGTQKVDLSAFNELDLNAIHGAIATKGASKEAILIAKGYPPAIKTASINANKWKYYKKKSSSGSTIYFKNNIVIPKPEVRRREVIYEDVYYAPVVPSTPSMPRSPRPSDFRPF